MNKHFDYSQREHEIYAQWESSGAFKPSGQGTPYFIPMPPPNITGQLHTGHALGTTLQDILIRYHRMRGDDTLFLPGYDHAGLGAQSKILEAMAQDGIENPTQEQFDEFAAEWTDSTRERITEQLKSLGASADWDQARYTLDEHYQEATAEAFKRLYGMGLIYYNHDDGQWYLKLAELAKPFIEALDNGELKIYPPEAEARLRQTPDGQPLEEAHDWCISRQIMWGHHIPMWKYHNTKDGYEIWAPKQINQAQTASFFGGNYFDWEITPSPDRLDTWFSSSLWIFAALGWPNQTPEFDRYFPAATLETGWDIMFFWAARMSMMSLALTGQLPFKELYLHGLIRDDQGEKMSKSLGNGTDPLEQAAEYGTDALRWALAAYQEPGRDRILGDDQLETGRRLATKLWNIGKFIKNDEWYSQNMHRDAIRRAARPHCTTGDWEEAYAELDETRHLYDDALERRDFPAAAQLLRSFIFDYLSGELIPAAKAAPGRQSTQAMRHIYAETLKMAHPFQPFITEELWGHLGTGNGLLIDQRFSGQSLTQAEEDALITEMIDHDIAAFGAAMSELDPWELPLTEIRTVTTLDELVEEIGWNAEWLDALWDTTTDSIYEQGRKAQIELALKQFPIKDLNSDLRDEFGIELAPETSNESVTSGLDQLREMAREVQEAQDRLDLELQVTGPAIFPEYMDEADPSDFRLGADLAYIAVAPPDGGDDDGFIVRIDRDDHGIDVSVYSALDESEALDSIRSDW